MNELIRGSRPPAAPPEAVHVIVDRENASNPGLEQALAAASSQLSRELVLHRASTQAAAVARAISAAGARRVIAVGDDLTFNRVVSGLMAIDADRRASLGIVPLTRGGVGPAPSCAGALLEAIVAAARPVDVGCWGGRWFLDLVSGGAINERPRGDLIESMGGLSYALAGALGLPAMRPVELRVRGDSFCWSGSAYALAIANLPRTAGGFGLCPGADPTDGELDVTVIPASLGLAEVLELLAERDVSGVATIPRFRGAWVELSAGSRVHLCLGGQLRACRRARFELAPGAIMLAGGSTSSRANGRPRQRASGIVK